MAFFPSALQQAGWTGPACVLCLLIGSLKSENATQVLYVANAEMLTDGGFFSYNEAAGGWDTPQSAQFILHNLLASHKDALGAMRTTDGVRSLAEVDAACMPHCSCRSKRLACCASALALYSHILGKPAISSGVRRRYMCILTYLTVYNVEVIWGTEIVCAQVALEGVDSSSHAVAVDAALAVIEGLETQAEVSGA